MSEQLTVTEAAVRYGLSRTWVRVLLEQGRLQGRLFGRTWVVESDEIERYIQERQPPGRPKGSKNEHKST